MLSSFQISQQPPADWPAHLPDSAQTDAFPAEKTFEIKDGQAIDVKISVDHDMVEVFVGEQVAFTYRIFRKPEYEIGLLAQDAKVEFANIAIRK